MESEKWPAFITGLVLGILVTLGVGGGFGWQKYQQARHEAMAAHHEARDAEILGFERLKRAEAVAEKAARDERAARKLIEELEEARKKLKPEPEKEGAKDRD